MDREVRRRPGEMSAAAAWTATDLPSDVPLVLAWDGDEVVGP
ncbi:hypothetical protein ACQP2F_23280 [Actinoplanes sp. CA-030573]